MTIKLSLTRTLESDTAQADTLAQHLRHCTQFTHYVTDDLTYNWVGTRPGWPTHMHVTARWPHEVATIRQLLKGKFVEEIGILKYSDRARNYGEVRWRPVYLRKVREAEVRERAGEHV